MKKTFFLLIIALTFLSTGYANAQISIAGNLNVRVQNSSSAWLSLGYNIYDASGNHVAGTGMSLSPYGSEFTMGTWALPPSDSYILHVMYFEYGEEGVNPPQRNMYKIFSPSIGNTIRLHYTLNGELQIYPRMLM